MIDARRLLRSPGKRIGVDGSIESSLVHGRMIAALDGPMDMPSRYALFRDQAFIAHSNAY
ncbi:hypothetical protein [Trinickia soli]|uniref:hypothetical protein n=1 Tax=Trinickia soli TaxID=380675 RepID=UPI0011AFAE30|nr:hypothetical protein [Trinickia soli]